MLVYLTKKQIFKTPIEKETVFMFTVLPSLGSKEIKTKKHIEGWRIFKTEQEALNYLNKQL
jgi:hypothetical protein